MKKNVCKFLINELIRSFTGALELLEGGGGGATLLLAGGGFDIVFERLLFDLEFELEQEGEGGVCLLAGGGGGNRLITGDLDGGVGSFARLGIEGRLLVFTSKTSSIENK